MTRDLQYSVGNENNPGDPWGRSELVVKGDGAARLEHHFSRSRTVASWTGRVATDALDSLWHALQEAGFPTAPTTPFAPGSSLRRLTVAIDGVPAQAILDWHSSAFLPGYAEAFDLLDGIIRQLSGDTVTYPTRQPPIVHDIAAVAG